VREIKETIIQQAGGMIFVKYSHFKSPHLYMGIKGHPIHCCQCDADIPENDGEAFIEHIILHSKRKNHRFLVSLTPDLVSGCNRFGELIRTRQEIPK